VRGILPTTDGAPILGELPDPEPGPGEVLVEVRATALNRADLLQIHGHYPPPAGESEVPGLECAGVVEALGDDVDGVATGDRVMALLAGGGHAQRVSVPVGQLMPMPEGLSFAEATAIPEVGITAWTNLAIEGSLSRGQAVLITAAASGVGTFAVQIVREVGARALCAGRTRERLERLRELGSDAECPLGQELPGCVRKLTEGVGADLVLDMVGGPDFRYVLEALRERGTAVVIGLLAGRRAELDLGLVLRRRLRIAGSVLRSRSRSEKAGLVRSFQDFAAERLGDGRLRPVVDRVLPFEQLPDAYRQLAEDSPLGKIVVEIG
jgi:putative PIG3 family NAD(P)H quinone oxidoreductase